MGFGNDSSLQSQMLARAGQIGQRDVFDKPWWLPIPIDFPGDTPPGAGGPGRTGNRGSPFNNPDPRYAQYYQYIPRTAVDRELKMWSAGPGEPLYLRKGAPNWIDLYESRAKRGRYTFDFSTPSPTGQLPVSWGRRGQHTLYMEPEHAKFLQAYQDVLATGAFRGKKESRAALYAALALRKSREA